MKKVIYTITSMYVKQPEKPDWPTDYKDRIVGFYFDLKTAKKCVDEDWAGFSEGGYYNFIVIERLTQGIYPFVQNALESNYTWWYKHDDNLKKWLPCQIPKCFHNVCGFSIG